MQDSASAGNPDQVPEGAIEEQDLGSQPPETALEEQDRMPTSGAEQQQEDGDEQQPGSAGDENAPAEERNAVEAPAEQPAEAVAEGEVEQ